MSDPVVSTGMLIRRPVAEVFGAFADPAVTTRFWFTDATGPLEAGAKVAWTWAMYGVSTEVEVKSIEPDRLIRIVWDNATEPTEVEWTFEPRGDETWVRVENRGFAGTPAEKAAKAIDSTGGFNLVLAGAKIWLEHAIEPRFVEDHMPDHYAAAWRAR